MTQIGRKVGKKSHCFLLLPPFLFFAAATDDDDDNDAVADYEDDDHDDVTSIFRYHQDPASSTFQCCLKSFRNTVGLYH